MSGFARPRPGAVLPAQVAVVDQHRQQLLREQGVAVRRGDDGGAGVVVQVGVAEHVVDDQSGLLHGERLEGDDMRVGPFQPTRATLGQLRAGGADHQERRVRRGLRHSRDEIDKSGLGPVDVLEDHDQGGARQSFEQLAGTPVHLLDGELPSERPIAEATRSAAPAAPSSPKTAPSLARAIAGLSSSRIRAACRTISTSGQNVMPRPYARHPPRSTWAASPIFRANSSTSLDLPMPASPSTVMQADERVETTSWNSRTRRAVSSPRPTISVRRASSTRRSMACTASSRYAGTCPLFPRRLSGVSSATST